MCARPACQRVFWERRQCILQLLMSETLERLVGLQVLLIFSNAAHNEDQINPARETEPASNQPSRSTISRRPLLSFSASSACCKRTSDRIATLKLGDPRWVA